MTPRHTHPPYTPHILRFARMYGVTQIASSRRIGLMQSLHPRTSSASLRMYGVTEIASSRRIDLMQSLRPRSSSVCTGLLRQRLTDASSLLTPAHHPLRSYVQGYSDSVLQTHRSVLLCMRRRKPRLFGFQSGRKKLNYYREAGNFLFLYSKSIEHWLPFRHIRLT